MRYTISRQSLVITAFKSLIDWHVEKKTTEPLIYIDLYAGTSLKFDNDEQAELNSSRGFLKAAKAAGMPTISVLFEADRAAYGQLLNSVMPMGSRRNVVVPVMQDVRQADLQITAYAGDSAGLIYCDVRKRIVPADTLKTMLKENPKLDVVIQCDVGDLRAKHQLQKLRGCIDPSVRSHWFISAPTAPSDLIVFYGTDTDKWSVFAELERNRMAYYGDAGQSVGREYFHRVFHGRVTIHRFKPRAVKCPPSLHRDARGRIVRDAAFEKFVADHSELSSKELAEKIGCHATSVSRTRKQLSLPSRK